MSEKIIESNLLYEGRILNLRKNKVELENGKTSYREVVEHKKAIALVPVLDGKILFVKQYRSGAMEDCIEIPAGLIEDGEVPLDAALRELAEETGYTSKKMTYLGKYYSSPGFTDEAIHLYIAEELVYQPLKADDDEFITLYSYSIDECKKMLKNGEFTDLKTALGVAMFLNK